MKGLTKVLYVIIGLLCLLILVTLYAKTYLYVTVAFNTNGGNKIEGKKVIRREKIGKLPVPTKKNYTFLYWTRDNEKIDENYIVKENIVLVALYEKNKEEENVIKPDMKLYTIKYDTDGGSKIGDYTVVEGEKAKKPVDPAKEGYEFKEWTLDGKPYNFDSEVTTDIVLKATYIKGEVKTYTVAFDTNGGSKIEKKIVEENTVVAKPADPTKKGYTFREWQLDGTPYNFSSKVTQDITLIASYEKGEVKTYTVTFDTNGGNAIPKQTIEENGMVIKPSNPTKEGYTFKEWQLDNKTYDFTTKVTGDITLKAVYNVGDEKLSAFRSTVKLLITQAEKQYLVEQTSGSTITTSYADITACKNLVSINENEYSTCMIHVNASTGKATIKLNGKGKYEGYSCGAGGATISTVDTACKSD